jgi:hypothetical protein
MITKDEIQSTVNPAIIFRANSVATKSVDMYMRLMGMAYMHKILKPIICLICEETKDKKKSICELDPTRIPEEKEEKKSKIIAKNTQNLIRYTNMIFKAVVTNVASCPTNFRDVFENISENTSTKFQDSPTARFVAIAGFIFLRFFCPSLIAPKSFGLLNQYPSPTLARDLTLIAKCLQSLASLVTFGKKESFMINCNKYISENFEEMKKLLDHFCKPPDGVVDELPVAIHINWGREMARVHFHLSDNLEAMQAKFSKTSDLEELQSCLEKLDAEVKLKLNKGPRGRAGSYAANNSEVKRMMADQKSVIRMKPRVGSVSSDKPTQWKGVLNANTNQNHTLGVGVNRTRQTPLLVHSDTTNESSNRENDSHASSLTLNNSTPSKPNTVNGTEQYICPHCKLPCSNSDSIQAMDQRWHSNCFTCSKCDKQIQTSFSITNGKLLCDTCRNLSCLKCGLVISGSHLVEIDNYYVHVECFKCSICNRQLKIGEDFVEMSAANFWCVNCL